MTYNTPVAHAGINLKELSPSQQLWYINILHIREKVRSATENALGLFSRTLLVDFTTISQKTVGGLAVLIIVFVTLIEKQRRQHVIQAGRTPHYNKRIAASIIYLNNPTNGTLRQW